MVSISETIENQSHQIPHTIQQQHQQHQQHQLQQQQQLFYQQQQQQKQQQEQLIKSIQLYHNQHNKIMSSSKSTTQDKQISPPVAVGETVTGKDINKNIGTDISKQMKSSPTATEGEAAMITTTKSTTSTTSITTISKPPKSAVSQRSIEIEIEKTSTNKPRNLRLDLITTRSEEHSVKSPKTPKTPKSPLSAAGRLSHQTSLSSQIDIVEDRKTLRDALYQGIFHRHRKTIFAMGSFLRMLRSRNSQYNTIRSSSEGEDIDDTR